MVPAYHCGHYQADVSDHVTESGIRAEHSHMSINVLDDGSTATLSPAFVSGPLPQTAHLSKASQLSGTTECGDFDKFLERLLVAITWMIKVSSAKGWEDYLSVWYVRHNSCFVECRRCVGR